MLIGLHIKNYTIVDELQIDFNSGLTVVTGETGAGKSIIIDALQLALGARASSEVIRHTQERCDVSALFDITHNQAAKQWLLEHDLEEVSECILRRTITREGRSRSYLNNQPLPLQTLREFSEFLVDIHGQHEHQSLFKADTHRLQLDEFAKHHKLLEQLNLKFRQWQKVKNELANFAAVTQHHAQQELLRYQVAELDELALAGDEIEELLKEHQTLNQVDEILTKANQIASLLTTEHGNGIMPDLNSCHRLLAECKTSNAEFLNIKEIINTALINCQEAYNELNNFVHSTEPNPARLHEVESRLHQITQIARKHKVNLKDLTALHQQLQQQLIKFDLDEQHITDLTAQLQQLAQEYMLIASQLSNSRQQAAVKLAQAITNQIRQLGMPHATLEIQISSDDQIKLHGIDKVEYYITTNPGQPAKPLAKIVSGGELSRISLAIEVVTTQQRPFITMFFDEVDVGIGGTTAAIVGKLLKMLGAKSQVICVTHQPQVAAQGHHHYYVHKISRKNDTFSQVKTLTKQEKIQEIARMLGGLEITHQTLAHAAELLEQV